MPNNSSEFDQEIYAELHSELIEEFGYETEAWVGERLSRVMSRLNAVRIVGSPLTACSLALPRVAAFTTPAPYVYISRRLLEVLPSDEAVAFVLGHEIAHHDLGHLDLFRGVTDLMSRGVLGSIAAAVFRLASHRVYGPERETQADQYGVELCLDAGYDGERCLQAIDTLENEMLNLGDIHGVFGPEQLLDPNDPDRGSGSWDLKRWLWVRSLRYLPLRDRRTIAWRFYRRRLQERSQRESNRY